MGLLKQAALNYLPERLLRSARRLHYQRSLSAYDIAAEPDLAGCRALLKPGDTVIDIGANIGVYTRFCSEFVGAEGQVFSLEPVPETFSYLQANMRALDLVNVTCLPVGASDRDSDRQRMSTPQYAQGGANLYESRLNPEGDIPVTVARLDSLFPTVSPALIKCDVEGYELACVEGAVELVRRCKPIWLIEVTRQETTNRMRSLGYAPFVWQDGSFHASGDVPPATNYFFLPA